MTDQRTLAIMCQDIAASYATAALDTIHNIKTAPLEDRERARLRACRFQREAADYAHRARTYMGIE